MPASWVPRFLHWNVSTSRQLIQTARELHLQKGLSQNFLVDEAILNRIAQTATETDANLPIVEIGPGSGFLTERLLQAGHSVIAVEVDPKMIRFLEQRYSEQSRLRILPQDIRQVDLHALLAPKGIVVGNIPYHLTGPILFRIAGELADAHFPLRRVLERAILMLQKEVGERLLAKPGDKTYSQLTLQVQYWFEVKPVVYAPRTAFYPQPKVDSLVIEIIPRTDPAVPVKDLAFFSHIIKTGFMHRRKTLFNNLRIGSVASEERLKSVLEALHIPIQARPQELSLTQFGTLADALAPDR